MKPGKTGISRIISACQYSWPGLKAAWKHEAAFRQELIGVLLLVPLALFLGQSAAQIALMIASLFIVLIVELVNSAIEAVVDRFGDEHNRLSGRAKDIGSAAVFISLLNVLAVWGVIIVMNYVL